MSTLRRTPCCSWIRRNGVFASHRGQIRLKLLGSMSRYLPTYTSPAIVVTQPQLGSFPSPANQLSRTWWHPSGSGSNRRPPMTPAPRSALGPAPLVQPGPPGAGGLTCAAGRGGQRRWRWSSSYSVANASSSTLRRIGCIPSRGTWARSEPDLPIRDPEHPESAPAADPAAPGAGRYPRAVAPGGWHPPCERSSNPAARDRRKRQHVGSRSVCLSPRGLRH